MKDKQSQNEDLLDDIDGESTEELDAADAIDADGADVTDEAEGEETGEAVDAAQDEPNDESDESEESNEAEGDAPASQLKKKKSAVDRRRLRYGGMATGLTAVVIAVVVLVNVVAGILNDRFPINFDLTKDKLFTLSDESVKIAEAIDQKTQIIVFADENNFSNPSSSEESYNTMLRQFYESTRQYNTLSKGNVTTTFVDLVSNPTLATKYADYDVKDGDILFVCGTRYQKATVQDLFTYDEQSYYYSGQLSNVTSEVEKVVGSKLMMVTSDNTPVMTILTGHKEDSTTISGIKSVVSVNNYSTEELDITGSAAFNKESTVALIAAPETDYSDKEIDKLRTWLNNDGKYNRNLVVVINYKADCPNLYEFLNVEYGIEVTNNLFAETEADRMYNYNAYYPFADVKSGDFTADFSDSKVLMPITREILTNKENNTDNSLYNVDVVTFPESAKLVKLSEALAQTDADKELTKTDAKEYPAVGLAYATAWGYNSDNEKYTTNVMVSGCQQYFVSDVMDMSSVENEGVFLSLLNGFTGNEVTVNLSSRSLEQTKLEFTTGQANVFFFIFVLTIPLALLAVCLVIFLRRRRL